MASLRVRLKPVAIPLVSTLLLLLLIELFVRAAGLDRPSFRTTPFPQEEAGLFQRDFELFWSMQPHFDGDLVGARVVTNGLGLRASEIAPKAEGELRILSLGESTTFGPGVTNGETYSAILETLLRRDHPAQPVTVINAGVSAYTSFQSLKYLELRGLALEPDLVLFYHELNDYLPTVQRDSTNTEVELVRTDKQLYESRANRLNRAVRRASATARFLQNRMAEYELAKLDSAPLDPMLGIGLRNIRAAERLYHVEEESRLRPARLVQQSLGQRVTEAERREVLEELLATCRAKGIELVVIHPSYQSSKPHECLLTAFCQEHGVAMFEAYDALHPEDAAPGALFRDGAHPNAEGHARLAAGLARFLRERGPASDPRRR